MILKGRGQNGRVRRRRGGGGGGLALDFKDFWDGVYNFFFLLPLGIIINTKDDTFTFMCTGS